MKTFLNQTTNFGLLLFVLLSAYNIYEDITYDRKYLKNIRTIQKQIALIDKNGEIILQLQKERGLTSIYYANMSTEHLLHVKAQRKLSSQALLNANSSLKKSIKEIRGKVTQSKDNRLEIFYAYSEIIRDLLLDTEALTFYTANKTIKNELMVYNELSHLQEILGQIRAKVGVVLSASILRPEDIDEIKRRSILFEDHLEDTYKNDVITKRDYTKQISKTKEIKQTLRISKMLQKNFNVSNVSLSATEWFELSTHAILKINSFTVIQRNIINEYLIQEIKTAKEQRVSNAIFWLLGALILFIIIFISYKRSKELLKEQALLKNYKMAIDYAAIVSKTDTEGNITYINDNFTKLSGYTKNELIGKTHTIIKHPDMPEKLFDDMWDTITKGENWYGLIKNKKKDGGTYWADSYIIPIFDNHNKLVEYIAIRHNVSEIILLQEEIKKTQRELVYRLGEAVESRSKESGNHIVRVAHYSQLLAQLANLSQEECNIVFTASSMHDVGKIAIPDAILLKPAKLNTQEWTIMKTHSEIGYNLFKDSQRPILKAAANIAYEHHERYDGKGYPQGIKGDDICIFARIVAIADVFDALCSKRTYKEPWKINDVLAFLEKETGKQFDPHLIKLFLNNADDFIEILNRYK